MHRRLFGQWQPYLADLTGRAAQPARDRIGTFLERTTEVAGVPCRVVELTGAPGDAYLCSPAVLHAAAPNRSDRPRLMRVKLFWHGRATTRPDLGPKERGAPAGIG